MIKAKDKPDSSDDFRRNTAAPASAIEGNNLLKITQWIETNPSSLEVAKKMRNPLIMSRDPNLVDDKHRLQLRLDQYKLRKRNLRHVTSSRGLLQSFSNNLFIAIADQLFDTIERYVHFPTKTSDNKKTRADELRESSKKWLKNNGDFQLKPGNIPLKALLPKKYSWETYIDWLEDDEAWGDAFSLVA